MNVVSEVETSVSDSKVFLGEVSVNEHKPWTADIIVNQDCVTFKLDSGADVTVIPASTYNKLTDKPPLCKTQKKLYGPCRYELRCRGEFQAMLKYGPKSWKATIYVLDGLDSPLLGRIACQKLGVVAKVDEISSPERSPGHMKRTHPNVFTGLGCMPGELACVASVSVLFRSKERPRNEILGFGRARNETRGKKCHFLRGLCSERARKCLLRGLPENMRLNVAKE